jgi:hypothetical protein
MREKFDDKELGLQRLAARSLLASLDEVEKHRDHKPLSYSQIKSALRSTEAAGLTLKSNICAAVAGQTCDS